MYTDAYIRFQGRIPYATALEEMQRFNAGRSPETIDEAWLLEHDPVYTLGMNAREEHVLNPGTTPVVKVDRGGQVTWHGPGQLVVYVLLDLKRKKLGIRDLVCALERTAIRTLAPYGIEAAGKRDAPGVYLENGAKIASIGLRVRQHCCYHGLSLNVSNDLTPFAGINPCGYEGLAVTRTADCGGPDTVKQVSEDLLPMLLEELELRPLSY